MKSSFIHLMRFRVGNVGIF